MKNKKNNKGFTLIELLAVVVILLAISVMAISSISAAIERNKEKQNDTKKKIIVSYAKLYYEEHKNSINNNCINVQTLIDKEILNIDEAIDKVDEKNNTAGGSVKIENGNVFTYNSSKCSSQIKDGDKNE